jgi:RES domain
MTRQRQRQGPPPESLEGFPPAIFDGVGFRAARQDPWWFCTCGQCRFDLGPEDPSGLGTLYAGTDPVSGVLEVIGPEFAGRPVARRFVAERTVWALAYDRPLQLADLVHRRAAGFGVTNELSTMVPYRVPQAWAKALADAGWDGISYRTRFNTSPQVTGMAWFDGAGAHGDWPATRWCDGDDPAMIEALAQFGIEVAEPPKLAALQVL